MSEEVEWLEHNDPDCTGDWWGRHGCTVDFWRCPKCGAEYMETPEVRAAAIRENARSIELSLLAADPYRGKKGPETGGGE